MKKLLAKGSALALTLALALGACAGAAGGSGTGARDQGTWCQVERTTESTYEASDTERTQVSYELDEHGSVVKSTEEKSYRYDGGSTTYTTERAFTRDENGWPLTETITERASSAYSYDDGTGQMVEEESIEDPHVSEVTFTYEHDDEGRVTKASSSDNMLAQIELAYDKSGNVVKLVRKEPMTIVDEVAQSSTITSEFDAAGKLVSRETVTVDEFGKTLSVTTETCDEDGLVTKLVRTRPQDKGDDLVETHEYAYEKNADGSFTTCTETVVGDGVSVATRLGEDGARYREVLMPDGSVKAQLVEGNGYGGEVVSDQTTYKGPYRVVEQAFDDKQNLTSYRSTYYDGACFSHENTFDQKGNRVASLFTKPDGSQESCEYSYDENGNMTSSSLVVSTGDGASANAYASEEKTFTWTKVKEPAPFLSLNDKFVQWFDFEG